MILFMTEKTILIILWKKTKLTKRREHPQLIQPTRSTEQTKGEERVETGADTNWGHISSLEPGHRLYESIIEFDLNRNEKNEYEQ